MSQMTIISGVERRRVWTDEQKRALVAAACEPGASVAEIARRADLRPSQLYRWRRDLAEPVSAGFAAVTYDDIVDHCCDAWNKLVDQPWKIMSIGLRNWAQEF